MAKLLDSHFDGAWTRVSASCASNPQRPIPARPRSHGAPTSLRPTNAVGGAGCLHADEPVRARRQLVNETAPVGSRCRADHTPKACAGKPVEASVFSQATISRLRRSAEPVGHSAASGTHPGVGCITDRNQVAEHAMRNCLQDIRCAGRAGAAIACARSHNQRAAKTGKRGTPEAAGFHQSQPFGVVLLRGLTQSARGDTTLEGIRASGRTRRYTTVTCCNCVVPAAVRGGGKRQGDGVRRFKARANFLPQSDRALALPPRARHRGSSCSGRRILDIAASPASGAHSRPAGGSAVSG